MESEDGSGDRLDDRENGTELSCLDENKTLTPRDSTSCLSALEEELTCAICFELIVMPTSLTCGHTYCRHCLAHWCDVGKRMECPSCREKLVGLPQENVQIKSSIQKLFPEKYDYRLESTMASAENVNAIEGFEALVKKHRDEEDITAASCGFFIGVVIAIVAIATVYFMMFGFGSSKLWAARPLEKWDTEDVSQWLESLGLDSYRETFADQRVDGQMLVSLCQADLESLFYMHNPMHQRLILNSIEQEKTRSLSPTNLWEYKDINRGYTFFLLYSLRRTPRLALLYLYKYDRETFDSYQQAVEGCGSSSSETYSWWFMAGSFIAPQILHIKFLVCFTDVHFWISIFLIIQCLCKALLDLINIGKSFHAPQNISYFNVFLRPFLSMFMFYCLSYIWWLTPKLLTDVLFYIEMYCTPIYYIKCLFRELVHQQHN